jgi:hypothetical protein
LEIGTGEVGSGDGNYKFAVNFYDGRVNFGDGKINFEH